MHINRSYLRLFVVQVIAIVTLASLTTATTATASGPRPTRLAIAVTRAPFSHCPWLGTIYRSHTAPIRVADRILARMTLRQKVMLLGLATNYRHGLENQTTPIPALCVPILSLADGPVGLAFGSSHVTAFPSTINVAATFDPSLAYRYGRALGTEAKIQGLRAVQGPGLNVAVWANDGRNFENLGADPYLTSVLGAELTRGIDSTGVIAVAKHFGPYTEETSRSNVNVLVSDRALREVYLAPFQASVASGLGAVMCSVGRTNGVNSCSDPAISALLHSWGFRGIDRTDLGATSNEVAGLNAGVDLFKPFRPQPVFNALAAHVLTLATVDSADLAILTAIFTTAKVPARWRFNAAADATSKESLNVSALVDAESATLLVNHHVLPLIPRQSIVVLGASGGTNPVIAGGGSSAVHAGSVTTPVAGLRAAMPSTRITYDATTPHFVKLSLGQSTTGCYLRRCRVATIHLARNDVGLVDFILCTSGAAQLRVNGHPFLSVNQATLGGRFHYEQAVIVPRRAIVQIVWRWRSPPVVTAAPVGPVIKEATQLARRAQVAIVVVASKSSEGIDASSLTLPGYQNQLITAVARVNARTVIVVNSGGPVLMPWVNKVSAVLETWYPGQVDGHALAAVLTGTTNPSGRLPITFPVSNATAPMVPVAVWPRPTSIIDLRPMGLDIGQHWYDVRHLTPLFSFGYGLSYTTFSLRHLRVTRMITGYRVRVTVTNTGARAGRDVIEGYLTFPTTAGEPTRQLRLVGAATLVPGSSAVVSMALSYAAFTYSAPARGHRSSTALSSARWITAPGRYTLDVGSSATNLPLAITLVARG
jgi:beta-glucosidase